LASLSHRSVASAVSVLLLIALVLGGCVACAQPLVTKSAAAHPCCDPKGHCKPAPAQMDHTRCEGAQALLPDVVKPEVNTDFVLLPVVVESLRLTVESPLVATVDTSPPVSPLQQSSLLRI
jgi:hypothetical protein